MLQLRGVKMSKSLGNLVTVEEFLEEYEADVLRLVVLSSHYGKPLGFDDEGVEEAQRALRRLRGALRPAVGDVDAGDAADALQKAVEAAQDGFKAAMDDDFNTAGALGQVFNLVRSINGARDEGVGGEVFAAAQAVFVRLTGVLGLELAGKAGEGDASPFIEALIELRAALREEKQWALADGVRDKLTELGIALEDGAEGTEWRWN